jgi:hypothetical protein
MIILDFLFYYLTYWFNKNRNNLKWSTPPQKTTYALGLMTMGILYSFYECYDLQKDKSKQFDPPWYVYAIIALTIMKIYDYIYNTRNRYEKIAKTIPDKTGITDDRGALISIVFLGLFTLSPFIVITILVPFGGHTVK